MKKILIMAATALIALSSCSKTESLYMGEQEEISFRTINSVLTKSTPGYTGTLGVYAWDGSAQFFDHSEFIYSDGAWRLNGEALYWPNKKLFFTIYAPYSSAVTLTNGNIIAPITANDDFKYASKVISGDKGKLPVTLKHVQSKVVFNASCDLDNVVTIDKIELSNAATDGTVTIKYTGENENPAISWQRNPDNGKVTIPGITSHKVGTNNAQCGNELMIIPQGTAETIAKTSVEITYTKGTKQTTETLALSGNWERGKKYIYNLIFTSNEILFEATVEDWSEVPETLPDIQVK